MHCKNYCVPVCNNLAQMLRTSITLDNYK